MVLSCWIPGRPKTKGSLDFQPGKKCRCCDRCEAYEKGGRAVENVAGSGRWRQLMAYAMRIEMSTSWANDQPPLEGPVIVAAVFHLPVKDVAAGRCGDLDKLARNLLDALQDAGVYGDDVQVTRLLVDKVEAGERGPGVDLRVLVPS